MVCSMYKQEDLVCKDTGRMTRKASVMNGIMTKRRETLGGNIAVPVGPPDVVGFPTNSCDHDVIVYGLSFRNCAP